MLPAEFDRDDMRDDDDIEVCTDDILRVGLRLPAPAGRVPGRRSHRRGSLARRGRPIRSRRGGPSARTGAAVATLVGALLGVLAAAWTPPAAAVVADCDHGVNFSNGSTTRGLTATVTCVDKDTRKPHRRVQLRDGLEHGTSIWYGQRSGKPWREEQYQAGKRHGTWKLYDQDEGWLQEESTYENDRERGPYRRFDKDGRVRTIGWRGVDNEKSLRIDYDAQGRITELNCPEQSRLPEDRALCGFGARGSVQFAPDRDGERRSVQYLEGRLDGTSRDLDADGRVLRERDWVEGRQVEERVRAGDRLQITYRSPDPRSVERYTYFPDGGRKAYARSADGRTQVLEAWWQNGRPRLSATFVAGERDRAEVRTFHDDGSAHETYEARLRRLERNLDHGFEPVGAFRSQAPSGRPIADGRYERGRFIGERIAYYPDGTARQRVTVRADGSRRVISYDERGRETADESFLPDGSRSAAGSGARTDEQALHPDGSRRNPDDGARR